MGSHARPDWTAQEIASLKELCDSGLYRFTDIAAKLGRPVRGIMYKCYERGFNNAWQTPFKYTYDRAFFARVTLETCYWAAILTTDGCVSWRNGRPTIIWATAEKDLDHMQRFKAAIQSTHPLRKGTARCNLSTSDTQRLHAYRSINLEGAFEWTADLERHFGITRDKMLRCPPPNLPTLAHRLAYIRGYVDGDGFVTCNPNDGVMSISVCGVNREMIAWVKDVVDSMDLPTAKKTALAMIRQATDENCYYYHVRGFRAAVLFELLRRLPVPHLARKWDNPAVVAIVDRWKARVDLWPPDVFFDNLLRLRDIDALDGSVAHNPPPIECIVSR